jgi:hypothetical protein
VTGTRRRLTGRIQVSLPPDEAFRLFTPRGEQDWAAGWEPRFPAPAPDDTEPGTVFETDAHGQHTIWLVLDRLWGTRISYARVTPGGLAGTVTIVVSAAGRHSEADVTYELTELSGTTGHQLRDFARAYPGYLQSWQDAIAAWLQGQPPAHPAHPRQAIKSEPPRW